MCDYTYMHALSTSCLCLLSIPLLILSLLCFLLSHSILSYPCLSFSCLVLYPLLSFIISPLFYTFSPLPSHPLPSCLISPLLSSLLISNPILCFIFCFLSLSIPSLSFSFSPLLSSLLFSSLSLSLLSVHHQLHDPCFCTSNQSITLLTEAKVQQASSPIQPHWSSEAQSLITTMFYSGSHTNKVSGSEIGFGVYR